MVEHNDWTLHDKAAHTTATLTEPAAHIPHGIPTEATYEEIAAALEIAMVTTT
jgi:hypothetical protein